MCESRDEVSHDAPTSCSFMGPPGTGWDGEGGARSRLPLLESLAKHGDRLGRVSQADRCK